MAEQWVGRASALEGVALFDGVAPRLLRRIASVVEWRRYDGTDVVLRMGEPVHELVVIREGTVALRRSGAVVGSLGPGGVVGHGTQGGDAAPYDAVAIGTVLALAIGTEELQAITMEAPEVARKLAVT